MTDVVASGMARPAESGWIEDGSEGREHVFPVRVYYEDTDAGGVVYHANYLRFAERARTELLRLLGFAHEDALRAHGFAWIVRTAEMEFMRPARLDDSLTIRTGLLDLSGARADIRQTVMCAGAQLASLKLRLVCVNQSGRPVRLPGEVRSALAPFQRTDGNFPTDSRA